MYFNSLPLRVKVMYFLIVATVLSFIVHFAATFSIASEVIFLTFGIILGVISLILGIVNLLAYLKERE